MLSSLQYPFNFVILSEAKDLCTLRRVEMPFVPPRAQIAPRSAGKSPASQKTAQVQDATPFFY